jgi:hypothetical protein
MNVLPPTDRLVAMVAYRAAARRAGYAADDRSRLDPEEFARLLRSSDPDDLKRLARAMSKPDNISTLR